MTEVKSGVSADIGKCMYQLYMGIRVIKCCLMDPIV